MLTAHETSAAGLVSLSRGSDSTAGFYRWGKGPCQYDRCLLSAGKRPSTTHPLAPTEDGVDALHDRGRLRTRLPLFVDAVHDSVEKTGEDESRNDSRRAGREARQCKASRWQTGPRFQGGVGRSTACQ